MGRRTSGEELVAFRRSQKWRLVGTYLLWVPIHLVAGCVTIAAPLLALEYGEMKYWVASLISFSVFMAICIKLPNKIRQLKLAIESLDEQIASSE